MCENLFRGFVRCGRFNIGLCGSDLCGCVGRLNGSDLCGCGRFNIGLSGSDLCGCGRFNIGLCGSSLCGCG